MFTMVARQFFGEELQNMIGEAGLFFLFLEGAARWRKV
jgi:hypothetical protein